MNINDNVPNVVRLENEVKAITKKEKWDEIEIITGLLNTFTNGFNRMGTFTIEADNENESIWLLLSVRCYHSTMCAYRLMYSGYYSQATTIIRSITEDVLICMACPTNKKIRDYILSRRGKLPSFSSMAKNANAPEVYKMYRHQCKFAHSSKLTLGILSNKGVLKVAPSYDELLFNYCMEAFIRTSVMMTEYLARVLYYLNKDEARAFDKENGYNLRRATGWLKDIEKRYVGNKKRD